MPNPATFTLQFLKGLDTSKDSQLQLEGELTRLEDAVIDKPGAITKRLGYDSLTTSINTGGSISEGRGLAVFDDELLLFDGSEVYSYSTGLDKWIDRGYAKSVIVEDETILRNDGYQQTAPYLAVLGNLELHTYSDERGSPRYTLIDRGAKSRIIADTEISSDVTSGTSARCIVFNSTFYILYGVGDFPSATIKYRTVNTTTGAVSSASTFVSTDFANRIFEVCVATSGATSRLFIVYGGAAGLNVQYLNTNGSISAVKSSAAMYLIPAAIESDSSGNVWILDRHSSNVIHLWIIAIDNTTQVLAPKIIYTNTTDTITRATFYISGTTGTFFFEYLPSGKVGSHWINIHSVTCTLTGTLTGAQVFARTVGLIAKPFQYNSTWYLPVLHDSAEQPCIFIIDSSGNISAKVSYQRCGGLEATTYFITPTINTSTGIFEFDHTAIGTDEVTNGIFFTREGIKKTTLDFHHQDGFVNIATSDQLLAAGGIVQSYDRAKFTEHNFNLYPENITLNPHSGGAMTASGTYRYKAVFAWTDAKGNQVVSRPSTSTTVTLGSSDGTVTVKIPLLSLTAKTTGVRIEIYRTTNNGSSFFLVSSSTSPIYNSTTSDFIAHEDSTSDTGLTSNKQLYATTNVEVANIGPGAAKLITAHRDRIWLSGLEEDDTVQFTKLLFSGISAEFADSSTFTRKISAVRGPITEIFPLDDALIVFKEHSMFAVTGEGPGNDGTSDTFNSSGVPVERPQVISSSIGCVRANTVCEAPPGLFFVSAKGIYLLKRGNTLDYVGIKVRDYNELTFTSADRIPESSQVRFTTEEGYVLVYDYYYENWAVWKPYQLGLTIVDAAVWQNKHILLDSSGKVYVQKTTDDVSPYDDDGYAINMVASSSWYLPSQLLGEAQLNSVAITGEYLSSHNLTLDVAFNNSDSFSKTAIFDATTICSTPNSAYYMNLNVIKKISSFKITLTEDGSGSSAKWSGLRAELFDLGKLRLPAKRRR